MKNYLFLSGLLLLVLCQGCKENIKIDENTILVFSTNSESNGMIHLSATCSGVNGVRYEKIRDIYIFCENFCNECISTEQSFEILYFLRKCSHEKFLNDLYKDIVKQKGLSTEDLLHNKMARMYKCLDSDGYGWLYAEQLHDMRVNEEHAINVCNALNNSKYYNIKYKDFYVMIDAEFDDHEQNWAKEDSIFIQDLTYDNFVNYLQSEEYAKWVYYHIICQYFNGTLHWDSEFETFAKRVKHITREDDKTTS